MMISEIFPQYRLKWHHIEALIKEKIENEFLNITKLDSDKIRSYGEAGVIADINKKLRFLVQRKNKLFTEISKKYGANTLIAYKLYLEYSNAFKNEGEWTDNISAGVKNKSHKLISLFLTLRIMK